MPYLLFADRVRRGSRALAAVFREAPRGIRDGWRNARSVRPADALTRPLARGGALRLVVRSPLIPFVDPLPLPGGCRHRSTGAGWWLTSARRSASSVASTLLLLRRIVLVLCPAAYVSRAAAALCRPGWWRVSAVLRRCCPGGSARGSSGGNPGVYWASLRMPNADTRCPFLHTSRSSAGRQILAGRLARQQPRPAISGPRLGSASASTVSSSISPGRGVECVVSPCGG